MTDQPKTPEGLPEKSTDDQASTPRQPADTHHQITDQSGKGDRGHDHSDDADDDEKKKGDKKGDDSKGDRDKKKNGKKGDSAKKKKKDDDEEDEDDEKKKGKDDEDDDDDSKDDDEEDDEEEDDKKERHKASPLTKLIILIVFILLLIAGSVYLFHWWTRGRFQQSTDNAYLNADQVTIAPRIAGFVEEVLVGDNQTIAAGQPLARVQSTDYAANAEEAKASIAKARAEVGEYRAQIRQQDAQIAQSKAKVLQSEAQVRQYDASTKYYAGEVARYTPLAASGAETDEKLAQMRWNLDQSAAQLDAARADVAANQAQVEYAQRQIAVYEAQVVSAEADEEQGQAQLKAALVNAESSVVVSPIAGRVANRTVRVGPYVQAGTNLMTVVPVQALYLDANFKETQIGLMRVGQPATIHVDALSEELHGVVESFSPGTGQQFALVPTDYATGNFTKIVQRVPVRIRVDAGPEARKVLVPGLSVVVSVDTTSARDQTQDMKDESKADEKRKRKAKAAGTQPVDVNKGAGRD